MLAETILGVGLFFVCWFIWLWQTSNVLVLARRTSVDIQRAHYVQAILHTTIYVYWSLYWDEVSHRSFLIAFQIVFAYLFELLLTWSRGKAWRLRFAPFPVVYSLNLFLWFKDEYFALQLLMLAGAYLAKEFLTWERNGRRSHIFNPSAFPLSVTGLLLMATRNVGLTYGLDLTWSFSVPPHFYEVIFCLGLVVQFLFSTTWITSSAVVTLWLLHNIAEWVLGTPLTPRPFDPAIFLGLTFLVTDPVTSPRSAPAKSIFGVLYGLGIFGAFIVLRWIQEPSYFDKILAVPVLNLLVPWCEVAGDRLRALSRTVFRRDFNLGRAGALAVYVVIFLLMIGEMTKGSQGFETPLPIHSVQLSATMQELRIRSEAFRLVHPEVYSPFAWREEWRNYRRLSSYAPKTVDEHVAFGRTYAALGRLDDALRILQTAVQLDPESADAQLYLGHTYLQRGQFADATRHLVAALEIRPDDPEAQLYLGTAWGMMGRTAEAMEQFRRTLTVEPNNATALVNLGRLLVEQGDTKEGLNCLYRAVETHPASVVAHWHLATVLYRRGEFDQARRHFERVVFILPDHAEARRMLVSVAAKH